MVKRRGECQHTHDEFTDSHVALKALARLPGSQPLPDSQSRGLEEESAVIWVHFLQWIGLALFRKGELETLMPAHRRSPPPSHASQPGTLLADSAASARPARPFYDQSRVSSYLQRPMTST